MKKLIDEAVTGLRRRSGRYETLAVLVVAGLLLWARLIVVSDMPRTAIAEPESAVVTPDKDAANSPSIDDADVRSREDRTLGDRGKSGR